MTSLSNRLIAESITSHTGSSDELVVRIAAAEGKIQTAIAGFPQIKELARKLAESHRWQFDESSRISADLDRAFSALGRTITRAGGTPHEQDTRVAICFTGHKLLTERVAIIEAAPAMDLAHQKDIARASDHLEACLRQHGEKLGHVDDVVRPQLGKVEERLLAMESNADGGVFEQLANYQAAIATT